MGKRYKAVPRTCCHLGSGWEREAEEVDMLVLPCAENTLENREEAHVGGCVLKRNHSLGPGREGRLIPNTFLYSLSVL